MGDPDKNAYPVINNVLCFASTARHTMKKDEIVRISLSFFKEEDILKAKDAIYELAGERPIRRRQPNRMLNEMNDIMDMLKNCDDVNIELPKYVADSFDSLPPISGYGVIAGTLTQLLDEISLLKEEVSQLKEQRMTDNMIQNDITMVKEDLITLKGEMRKLNHRMIGGDLRRDSITLESLVEPHLPENIMRLQSATGLSVFGKKNLPRKVGQEMNFLDFDDASAAATAPPLSQESPGRLLERCMDAGGIPSAPSLNEAEVPTASESHLILSPKRDSYAEMLRESPKRSEDLLSVEQPPNDNGSNTEAEGYENGVTQDDEGYILYKRRRRNRNRHGIIGSRVDNKDTSIKSAARYADIYVGNCDISVTEESLSDYIFDVLNIRVNNCEPLASKTTQSKSFKINLKMIDREKLLSAEVWPEGIYCRKYYNSRSK